jgi:protein-L-isoaspartate(D-aspartate) O-methyltransferase
MHTDASNRMNLLMVDRMIAQGSLWTSELIAAFRATPRHRFLDRIFVFQEDRSWREVGLGPHLSSDDLKLIYADRALTTRLSGDPEEGSVTPISSSSQPSLMAQMLEDLRLSPGQRVLEIGAGTGYNAALLARVAGPGRVVSVDVDREVLGEASRHLQAFADRAVTLVHADGRVRLPNPDPWDRIMVTAATPDVEPAWIEQLLGKGILVAPLTLAPGLAFVVRGTVNRGTFEGRLTRTAYFMPLRSEEQTGEHPEGDHEIPGSLQTRKAPWIRWAESSRSRSLVTSLVQSLAFYGYLKGMKVTYQTLPGGQAAYGLKEGGFAEGFWIGTQLWFAEKSSGIAMARKLWRAFLEAGAPRPSEFRLRISLTETHSGGDGRVCYVVHGPRCRHLWELIEPRRVMG